MMTFFWFSFVFCLISAFGGSSTSTNIECDYGISSYDPDDLFLKFRNFEIYFCWGTNNLNITTEESAEINSISGTHEDSKVNDDVLGFDVGFNTIQFFPKGLDKFFKNLKVINIHDCKLKEIHQSDLKVFPNLVYFKLSLNEIEVIEEGLFDFNPHLELVGFEEPKIIHIDPNVFDNLAKLSDFWFEDVPCVTKEIYDSREEVQEAIKVVKSSCSSSEFLSLDNQIKNLEIKSKTLNSEDFNTKLETFEKSFNNSKFSKFRPLNYKVQNLKLNYVNLGNNLGGNLIFCIIVPLFLGLFS